MEHGSFEAIAEWYDQTMGEQGDRTHRHWLLPALLQALGDVAGKSALDLGCGNGLASRLLAEHGARVIGIDLSHTLVARARAREASNPLGIDALVADAAHLPFPPDRFDLVTAHMVLMDAADGAGILREAGRVVRPGGRFVATLLHPCFEPPLASAWTEETVDGERRTIRRVWRYRTAYSVADRLHRDQPAPIMRYHRPLEWYARHLRDAGLLIDTLDEPLPDEVFAVARPATYQRQLVAPSFLVLGARKREPPATL